jgi:hypothetical protein
MEGKNFKSGYREESLLKSLSGETRDPQMQSEELEFFRQTGQEDEDEINLIAR